MSLQTIQAATAGDIIPLVCQRAATDGTITPVDFTNATVTVEVTPSGGAPNPYDATVTDATQGEISLATVTTMFTVSSGLAQEQYSLQVVGVYGNGNVYRSPRAAILVLA